MFSINLHVLSQTFFLKLWAALLIAPVENYPMQWNFQSCCLALDEAFKKDSCITSQTYFQGIQIWRELGDYCSFSIICRQFL